MDTTQTATAASTQAPLANKPETASSPIVTMTAAAVAQVKTVMAEQKLDGYVLTVRAVPGGCSGFTHELNLLKDATAGDLQWEQDGIRLCTDGLSAKLIGGTVMDFIKTDTTAGFKFENPNAKSTCGCGSSFSV